MIIDYTITKKHGSWRPKISIKILWEDWEKKLNSDYQEIEILSAKMYSSDIPHLDKKTGIDGEELFKISAYHEQAYSFHLPYRPGKNPAYPEVEQALQELQEKHEAAVLEAYESIAFERTGKIEPSSAYKKKIAPWVAKQKMIKGVENE